MFSLQLDKIRESIRAGQEFELHCHSMTLRAARSGMRTFGGPGVIRIESSRKIRFAVYADTFDRASEPERGLSGELVPDDTVYGLSAIDESGIEWTSARVLRFRVQPNSDMTRALVTGDLSEICSNHRFLSEGMSLTLARKSLTLSVFEQIDIPLNTRTVTSRHLDGDEFPLGGAELNVAKLETENYKFSFTRHDDLLELRVEGEAIAPAIESRVIESLQFVLARPIRWMMLNEDRDATIYSRIRAVKRDRAIKSYLPPIDSLDFYDKTKCVWPLFVKYFEYIAGHEGPNWHPLSRFVYSTFEARAAGYDTYRLVLGVAVEGILNRLFKHVHKPDKSYLLVVDTIEKHLQGWSCMSSHEEELSFRNRFASWCDHLRAPSASDRLWALRDKGLVSPTEFDAWKQLRNKTAHADQPDQLPTQGEIDQVDTVTTLMHKLVFQAIGYTGKYTDYGSHGFPIRDFVCT
jgi:hypothetical protein